MIIAIRKLIGNIDQLVEWLYNNSGVPMPSREKQRAIFVLNKIMQTDTLSDLEYEQLKPELREKIYIVDPNSRNNDQLSYPRLTDSGKKKQSLSKNLKSVPVTCVSSNQKDWTNCPDCKTPVLRKNLLKHRRKKCKYASQENQ